MKKKLMGLVAAVSLVFMVGCASVDTKARNVIDANATNARYINDKIQEDATLPTAVKNWWKAEVRTWDAMSAWANGKAPTPAVANP